jgi:predicted dehydrogenase
MGDAFADRLQSSLKTLKEQKDIGDRVAVDADHCFVGFDAYKKVIDSCDVVLLAEPPHFRPITLKAAIEAGKNVFCEKPVAVDIPGIYSILETAKKAEEKGLSIVSGLCWRYDNAVQETMKRIHDGAIGDILAIQETYVCGYLWERARRPDWTEMEFQVRNWTYFTWLAGDINAEQHIHSLDKGAWALGDPSPLRAWGIGGRQVRTEPKFGNIYDHHAVVYDFPNDVKMYSYCRQQAGCYNETSDVFIGTKGRATIIPWRKHFIEGENPWKFSGKEGDMYDLEHEALFKSIREGKPINNGAYMANSTAIALLGRTATYTGQMIAWEDLMKSKQSLAPEKYSFDADPPILPGKDGAYPIAMPGVTKFV